MVTGFRCQIPKCPCTECSGSGTGTVRFYTNTG